MIFSRSRRGEGRSPGGFAFLLTATGAWRSSLFHILLPLGAVRQYNQCLGQQTGVFVTSCIVCDHAVEKAGALVVSRSFFYLRGAWGSSLFHSLFPLGAAGQHNQCLWQQTGVNVTSCIFCDHAVEKAGALIVSRSFFYQRRFGGALSFTIFSLWVQFGSIISACGNRPESM